jgi:ABC-2 type transport system ATP-binding protein
MIEIHGVSRRYGERIALDGVSLAVSAGEIVGLLGPNGAGKSTLMRIAAGLLPPDRGRVAIAGTDLWEEPLPARRRLGYAAEEPSFYEELSAAEYLAFVAGVRELEPVAARERAAGLFERFGLSGRIDEPVRRFSHGMRKKLSFLAAILHDPAVLLCDEALEGFDTAAGLAARDELRALAARGTAVLFSSHVTETVERLCDRVVLLHLGRVHRSLARSDWGGSSPALSALEREFLAVTSSTPS